MFEMDPIQDESPPYPYAVEPFLPPPMISSSIDSSELRSDENVLDVEVEDEERTDDTKHDEDRANSALYLARARDYLARVSSITLTGIGAF
jgi:hypothetical protein